MFKINISSNFCFYFSNVPEVTYTSYVLMPHAGTVEYIYDFIVIQNTVLVVLTRWLRCTFILMN